MLKILHEMQEKQAITWTKEAKSGIIKKLKRIEAAVEIIKHAGLTKLP